MELLVFLFFLVVGVSFLCSILESIILSVNVSYIGIIEKRDSKTGLLLRRLKNEIDKSISSILILNTFANTLGATAIGVQAQSAFGNESNFVLLVSIALTFMILFFAEIIPKTIGALYWKELAPLAARLINIFIIITYPIMITTLFLTKKIGANKDCEIISREELIHSTLLSEEDGIINYLESDIIENTLKLKEIKVKDILTPRSVVFALDKEVLVEDILQDKRVYKFSRVPIYDKSIDNIIGLVLTKNILRQALKDKTVPLKEIMSPIKSMNENIPVSKALNYFIQSKGHMIYIVDGYDQTEGILTLEDCIETLLGLEIVDEVDTAEDMRKLAKDLMRQRRKQREKDEEELI